MNCFHGINVLWFRVFKYVFGVLAIMVGYGFPISFTYGLNILMAVWTISCMGMVNW